MLELNNKDLQAYEKLTEEFISEGDLAMNDNIEMACKVSQKRLVLARKFAEIDNKILDLSLSSKNISGVFFSELLFLEAKRLRFKEEALKCQTQNKRSKIKT